MALPLSVALICTQWTKEASGGATFEEDVLFAALASESSHRLVVYPANARMKSVVKDSGLASRVTLVKEVREPRLPRRVLGKAGRFVLHRKRPLPFARVDGAAEQFGDAGMLVDPLDPRAYASAVRALRDDPHRTGALVERGRERARGWTAAHYVAAVLALIDARIAPVRTLWS